MDRAKIEEQIAQWKREEQQHRVLAEQCAGARQAYEFLLKSLPADAVVREFPVAVPDATGTS